MQVELAMDEEGQFSGETKTTPVSFLVLLRDLWKDFVTESLITQVTGLAYDLVVTGFFLSSLFGEKTRIDHVFFSFEEVYADKGNWLPFEQHIAFHVAFLLTRL